jgi:hypothetical protein
MVNSPRSTLALFVPRVAANDQQLAVPPHQLAVFTDPFDARTHFHGSLHGKRDFKWKNVMIAKPLPRRQGVLVFVCNSRSHPRLRFALAGVFCQRET